MSSSANQLLNQNQPRFGTAKFILPTRPRDLLQRSRLLDFLHEHIHLRLNLVCAAAGYGKTSLLIDFAHDTDYPIAWCRLDESDADWVVFAADLLAAIRSPFPEFQSMLPELIGQTEPADLAKVLIREIETNIDQYFILVLDDFHLTQSSPDVIRFVNTLLANLPDQAHVLLAGRALPPLKMTALVARQQVAGLSEEHLRFTSEEVQVLVQLRNGVSIASDEAEKITGSAEGWITGILLTAHLMWQGPVASLMRARTPEIPLYEYLAEEVLDGQPEPLRQFLLESAVIPDMEPFVCDAVLDRTDSAELLHEAETRRLFVSAVGDEILTYQYHHLFRDFLIAKLANRAPARLRELRSRAAEWYAGHDMPEAAVTFYVLAENLKRAGEIAETHAPKMFSSGRHSTLRRWAKQLASIELETPNLYLLLGVAEIDTGNFEAAENSLSIGSAGFLQRNDQDGYAAIIIEQSWLAYHRNQINQALVLAEQARSMAAERGLRVLTALSLRYSGIYEFNLSHLGRAEELLRQSIQSDRAADNSFNLALTLTDLSEVLHARGEVTAAIQTEQEALEIWRQRGTPGPLALALNFIALGMHQLGQYQSALATYAEALTWVERSGNSRWEANILVGEANLLADLGDTQSARERLRLAAAKAEQANDQNCLFAIYQAVARLELWAQNFTEAAQWLEAAPVPNELAKPVLDKWRGLLLVDQGQARLGRDLLNQACIAFEAADRRADLAQALFFRAYAEIWAGDAEAASVSIKQAFDRTDDLGHDQMLLSEALSMRAALSGLTAKANIGLRLRQLFDRAEAIQSSLKENKPQPTSSTGKERKGLSIYALGSSRIELNSIEIPRMRWSPPKARELFLFLVDRAPLSRDETLATFWPDMSLARAAANMRVMLYRLRRVVGTDIILIEDQTYKLSDSIDFEYDVKHFEAIAKSALALSTHEPRRIGLLAKAAALYTGDYLPDLYFDWTLSRREELSSLHNRVLLEYADELINLTRYAEARAVLSKAIIAEPYRDELHERMLICLAELGQRHEMVNYYMHYRENLRNELGIELPKRMRDLYSRLLD